MSLDFLASTFGSLQIALDDLDREVPAALEKPTAAVLLLELLRSAREQLQQTEAMAQAAVDAA